MDKMPGESLHHWDFSTLPRERRIFLFSQLGDILGQLQRLRFGSTGSLYPGPNGDATFTIGSSLYLIENDSAVNLGGYDKTQTTFSSAFDAVKDMFTILEKAYDIPITDGGPDITIKREIFAMNSLKSSLSDSAHPFWSRETPMMLSHGDLRCANIMVDENMQIQAIIDWEWVLILPQQLCTPPLWVYDHDPRGILDKREMFQEFQSAITKDNTYHEYLQYWRANEEHLPLALILRHPNLLMSIFYEDVYPRLRSEPFSTIEADFFAREEHQRKFQERLVVAERYNDYLKANNLWVEDETVKLKRECIAKVKEIRLELAAFKARYNC